MMKKRIIVAILIACVAFAVWAIVQNRMTVTNNTGVTVQKVVVTVCGITYKFADIPDGKSKTRRFTVYYDSGFQVDALLADGTTLTNTFGYVTGGGGAYCNGADIEISKDRQIIGKQN